MKTFSILMPAYGTSKYIQQAIDSILAQQLPDNWSLEVLVGVDGDKDVLEVVKQHYLREPTVKIYHSVQNNGCYKTLNTLLHYSKGDLIHFFGSDDFMEVNTLSKIITHYCKYFPKYDIIQYGLIRADEHLQYTDKSKRRKSNCVSTVYSRKVLDTASGWEPWKCGADSEFYRRAFAFGFKHIIIEHWGYIHRKRPDQLTKVFNSKTLTRKKVSKEFRRRAKIWATGRKPNKIKLKTCEMKQIT